MSFISLCAGLLNQRLLFQWLFAIALGLVSWTCLIPLDGPVVDVQHFDKVLHFLSYFVLAGLFERAFPAHFKHKGIVGLIIYSALIELLQGQTQYRSASVADLIANSSGVFFYLCIQPWVLKLSRFSQPRCKVHE